MRTLLICSCLLALSMLAAAQENPDREKLRKGYELLQENKLKEGEEYLEQLVKKYPGSGDAWDLLVMVRQRSYEESKQMDPISSQLFSGNITVVTKDKKGREVPAKDDSLAKQLASILQAYKPSDLAYQRFIYAARRATLQSDQALHASAYLRTYLVDVTVDTQLSQKALAYYRQAEQAFTDKNYHSAALAYQQAIDAQPDFYKASLYLGDSYYVMGDYPSAITAFKAAVQRFPSFLEPRKYLTDAYAKAGLYDKALEEALQAMTVYPDLSMVLKLGDAAELVHKKLDIAWTPRPVFPNKMTKDTSRMKAKGTDEELTPKGPWIHYTEALPKVAAYCDARGIISRNNPVTTTRYLEVYSWEELLKTGNDPSLAEARRMQQAGYLDCYVLVTCFHQDFYEQYRDFAAKNRDRIIAYYRKFMITQQ